MAIAPRDDVLRLRRRSFCAALLAGMAMPLPVIAREPAGAGAQAGKLLAGIERVESVRAVKHLHNAWSYYALHGMWDAIGALFAEHGEMRLGDDVVHGRREIAARLRAQFGNGRDGLAPGAVHTQLMMTPIVTLAPDGASARGRWHEIAMVGQLGGTAQWAGGIQENSYIKQAGVWQIERLHYTPQFAGSYEDGWRNVSDDLGIVPYHFTPREAGTPVSALAAAALSTRSPDETLADAEQRIAMLGDEDAVRNLQYIYGYYLDRKMWADIVDLFAPDGTLDIEGLGVWSGPASIRRALERNGPAGLRHGELNDHVQIGAMVTVAPGGEAASARGIELGMVGRNQAFARWTLATFDNRFVKQDGVWKLAAMKLRPLLSTDYDLGWARDQSREPAPPPSFAPDRAASGEDGPRAVVMFDHPVGGRAPSLPPGLVPAPAPPLPRKRRPASSGSLLERISATEAGLRRVAGTDAVENISSALGNWIDDYQAADLAALFAADGERKSPSAGYYIGPERIQRMQELRNGPLRRPRRFIPVHLRIQPVIHMAQDGRTARLRTRLLQFNSAWNAPGSLTGGMYEDRLVLEDGVWRFQSNVINHIWRTPGYKEGWARVPEHAGEQLAPSPTRLLEAMPPDRPIDGPAFAPFPGIGPLDFHYRNPVSGRVPPDLLP